MKKRSMDTNSSKEIDEVEGPVLARRALYSDGSVLPCDKSLYEANRFVFLIQSAMLGISYAIVWPTLWMYVKEEFKELSEPVRQIIYGSVFVAYPVSSMLSAFLVQKSYINTRLLFMLLNLAEVFGNLIYALNFHPICLFIGRFIAGLGDAFYVVIMRDLKATNNSKSGSIAAECLAAFIVGLIMAQVCNGVTAFIPFTLGAWRVDSKNYPGVTTAILFAITSMIMRFFLSVPDSDKSYQESLSTDNQSVKMGIDTVRQWGFKSIFISLFSFIHTYVVSVFEIMIPILLYEKIHANALHAILLYGFIGLLYAMILMFTMSVENRTWLEVFFMISVLLKMLALFAMVCLVMVPMSTLHGMLALISIMTAITFMWSNDDVMYSNMILSIIPIRSRNYAHNSRKTTSKFAFIIAGVTVPFFNSGAMLYVGTILMTLLGVLFVLFVVIRTFSRPEEMKSKH